MNKMNSLKKARGNTSGETMQYFISNQAVAALTRATFLLPPQPTSKTRALPCVLSHATYSLWFPASKGFGR